MYNLKSEIADGATNLNTISKQNMLFYLNFTNWFSQVWLN